MLALEAGIPFPSAMAMSSVLFAGMSQFILAQLVGVGAPAAVMIGTVALVNLRHALYSASVAPHLGHLPIRWKLALSYLLTDEAYAASIGRLLRNGSAPNRHWHLLGAGISCGPAGKSRPPAGSSSSGRPSRRRSRSTSRSRSPSSPSSCR